MKEVPVVSEYKKEIRYQLHSLNNLFEGFESDEKIIFDFTDTTNINPLMITAISNYMKRTGSTFKAPEDSTLNSYLQKIVFPAGVTELDPKDFSKEPFTPIGYIGKNDKGKQGEKTLFNFLNLIYSLGGKMPQMKTAFYYPVA